MAQAESPPQPDNREENPLIFNIEEMEPDPDLPQTSVMSLDPKKSPSRARRTGSRR